MTTDLIPFSGSSLSDGDKLRAIRAVTAMLESFAQRPPGMGDFVKAFVANVSDVPIGAIEDTARRFSKGLVPGRNNAFPPSSAEFVEEATKEAQADLIRDRARAAIEATRRMIDRDEPEHTNAAKAAVQALADSFRDGVEAKKIAAKEKADREDSEARLAEIRRRMEENDGDVASPSLRAWIAEQDEIKRMTGERVS